MSTGNEHAGGTRTGDARGEGDALPPLYPTEVPTHQRTAPMPHLASPRPSKPILRGLLVSLALGGMASPIAVHAQDTSLTKADIKALALEAIRENPEIVEEAVQLLREREEEARLAAVQRVLTEERDALERDPDAPVIGNPDGDVTVVEFFDYNCPYCKRAKPEIEGLLAADSGVRFVMREWPILGQGSLFAAKAALAAREQGRYEEMHWALMALPRAEEDSVMRAAADLGLDLDRLREDMEAPAIVSHFERSNELTQALGFSGTPSFVIGDQLLPGLVPQAELEAAVDATRGGESDG